VLVADRAAQGVGFFDQAAKVVVLERQAITVRQGEANDVAERIEIHAVALAAKVAAGDDAVVFVVMDLQLAAQYIGGPAGALGEVIAEMVMLAVAGPVLHHTGLVVLGLPAVLADQAKGVAVADHQAFAVVEAPRRIAVAVDDFVQLAVVVVTVAHQGFHGLLVDDAFDFGQATERVLVMQVHPHTAGGADVGQALIGIAGELQVVTQCVFQAVQRYGAVVVRYFTEVEEHIVQSLQQVVATYRADQVDFLVRVVDALPDCKCASGSINAPLPTANLLKSAQYYYRVVNIQHNN